MKKSNENFIIYNNYTLYNLCHHKTFIGSRFERKLINVAAANEINKKKAFTVASYNVLSQHLLERHTENYVNCHKDVLGWEYRSGRIIEEILYFMPDVSVPRLYTHMLRQFMLCFDF